MSMPLEPEVHVDDVEHPESNEKMQVANEEPGMSRILNFGVRATADIKVYVRVV